MNLGFLGQEWPSFLAWFAMAFGVGAFSCWILRSRLGFVRAIGSGVFAISCWVYGLGLDDSLRHGTSLFFTLTLVRGRWASVFPLSLVQASIESTADAVRLSWGLRLVRCLATNILCLCLGEYVLTAFTRLLLAHSFRLHPGFWLGQGMWAYVVGLALTPLAFSVFRRVLPELRLHAGTDRLFEEGETRA